MKIILKKVRGIPFFIYTYSMSDQGDKKSHRNKTDLYIPNKSEKLKSDIQNIASHLGIPYGTFLRTEVIKLRDSYPDHMRQPPPKD